MGDKFIDMILIFVAAHKCERITVSAHGVFYFAQKKSINYLLDDVNAIMAENTESKLEIPTYDSNTAAMDTIRNSLQALATGASAQEVGDDIVDKMSAYE